MAGIKSLAPCLTIALCCGLPAGCSKDKSGSDASAAELREIKSQLAQAEKDRDNARMVLKSVRREAEKLRADLDAARATMRTALDRLKPLEDELKQLKKDLPRSKSPAGNSP
jgi:septal ring factor EnvC (AmiA/AmiB activator)